ELLGIVNVGIEHPGQCELAASVDDVVARAGRNLTGLADRDDAAILDGQRAVADDPAARIDGDEIVDIGNDEARHGRRSSWLFFRATDVPIPKFASLCGSFVCQLRNRRPRRSKQTDVLHAMSALVAAPAGRRATNDGTSTALGVGLQPAARDRPGSRSLALASTT